MKENRGKPSALMSPEEKLDALCKKGLRLLAEYIEENVPDRGVFQQRNFWFTNPIPDWWIGTCGLGIQGWYAGMDQRAVELFATFPESDRKMSIYWFHGTKEEVLAFLRAPERAEEMKKTYQGFSDDIRIHD